ncbi:MAG: hypothetical protein E6905_03935, partial [Actinomyces sp.]|nr:hypothetical protein [Actinomyces sp.]
KDHGQYQHDRNLNNKIYERVLERHHKDVIIKKTLIVHIERFSKMQPRAFTGFERQNQSLHHRIKAHYHDEQRGRN